MLLLQALIQSSMFQSGKGKRETGDGLHSLTSYNTSYGLINSSLHAWERPFVALLPMFLTLSYPVLFAIQSFEYSMLVMSQGVVFSQSRIFLHTRGHNDVFSSRVCKTYRVFAYSYREKKKKCPTWTTSTMRPMLYRVLNRLQWKPCEELVPYLTVLLGIKKIRSIWSGYGTFSMPFASRTQVWRLSWRWHCGERKTQSIVGFF